LFEILYEKGEITMSSDKPKNTRDTEDRPKLTRDVIRGYVEEGLKRSKDPTLDPYEGLNASDKDKKVIDDFVAAINKLQVKAEQMGQPNATLGKILNSTSKDTKEPDLVSAQRDFMHHGPKTVNPIEVYMARYDRGDIAVVNAANRLKGGYRSEGSMIHNTLNDLISAINADNALGGIPEHGYIKSILEYAKLNADGSLEGPGVFDSLKNN
jgi:hypothetical protein